MSNYLLDCRNHWRLFSILERTTNEKSVFVCCEMLVKILENDNKQFTYAKELSQEIDQFIALNTS